MRNFLILCLLTVSIAISGSPIQLSDNATISIITCAPFQGELYAAFGHSAIRVYDSVNNIDYAYNYGVFDFNQPNFYLNFTKGHLLYKLAVQSYPHFRYNYLYFNRWVHEQVTTLDQNQKQKIFEYLQWNAQPENQSYLYDYFYNNCATKIRDVFVEALGDKVIFDDSYIKTDYTIRQLTDLYLQDQPWGDLGIDICLGLPMDKKATPYEYMFLPDYIESSFNHASLITAKGNIPLVNKTLVSNPDNDIATHSGPPHPWIVFGITLVGIVVISLWDLRRAKLSTWLDLALLTVTGLIGLLLFVLWVATDHKAAAHNFNLLWALPTNLFAIYLIVGKPPKATKIYFGIATLLTVLLLLTWPSLPQQLNVFLYPIVLALGIRYALNYKLSGQDHI
ncbi:MAG TPA: DUF4105 domain-containing protein [Cyclobacteriaceae bacterium]